MRSETARLLGVIHLIVEMLVAVGFLLGMIPFLYLWSSAWVVPLVLISVLLSLIGRTGSLPLATINVALAFVSFIPLVGFVTRLLGAIVSAANLSAIRRTLDNRRRPPF